MINFCNLHRKSMSLIIFDQMLQKLLFYNMDAHRGERGDHPPPWGPEKAYLSVIVGIFIRNFDETT